MAVVCGALSSAPGSWILGLPHPCTTATPHVEVMQAVSETDPGRSSMSRYMPITGIDNNFPSLLIDTQAPIDVLHDTAAYRIRCVTQLLETISLTENFNSTPLLLQDLSRVIVIPLRDGCDLMDVIGRRLQDQVLST